MIDQGTIDRILDAANIVDVVGGYVTLRRSGASYKGLCPFHDDKTPSFYVNPARGICKCFSCGKGGNVVHFIMGIEQLTYYEALRFLAKKYGIEIKERELTHEELQSQSERESMFALNEWASHYYHDLMKTHPDGRAIGLAYFRSRGFRDDIIEKFRLGFSLDAWDNLATEAKKKGFREEFLVKTSLCIKRENGSLIDKFRGRAMFPWINVSGKVVAFGGRVLDSRTKGVNQKYVNSSDSVIYHKSNELYGIFQAKQQIYKDNLVYMVEGYTDVISMHQCGIANVVANSGTALNVAQIRLLRRFTSNITMIYDGDEAGIHAALRGTDMLLEEGMNVKVLLLPEGMDPDEFARKHTAEEFRDYVDSHQTDFILFKVGLMNDAAGRDPRKRSELATGILKSISVISDEIVRSSYVHECAEQMHMDEAMLLRECNKMRRQYIEQKRLERERENERKQRLQSQQLDAALQTTGQPSTAEFSVSGESPSKPLASPLTSSSSDATQAFDTPSLSESPVLVENKSFQESSSTVPPADLQPEETLSPSLSEQPSFDGGEVASVETVPMAERKEMRAADPAIIKMLAIERLIMAQVVRHGEEKINTEDEDGNPIQVSITEFVAGQLEMDGMTLRNDLYAQMLQEARAHQNEPTFSPARFFLCSPNERVSEEAAGLLTERYQLSKGQVLTGGPNVLGDQVAHMIMDYKFEVIHHQILQLKKQLADSTVVSDTTRLMQTMQELAKLNEVKKLLAEQLGARIM